MTALREKGLNMNHLSAKVAASVIAALIITFLVASVTWPYTAIKTEVEEVKREVNALKDVYGDVKTAVEVMKSDIGYIKDGIKELKARP